MSPGTTSILIPKNRSFVLCLIPLTLTLGLQVRLDSEGFEHEQRDGFGAWGKLFPLCRLSSRRHAGGSFYNPLTFCLI